jgi:purine-nucleoside phosphorylase
MTYFDQVSEAAAFLRAMFGPFNPRVGIVLGSGLGAVAEAVADPIAVPYSQIPHFPPSTVEGHSGRIVAGLLGDVPVIVMQGRVHFYEGYSPLEVTFPMRVLGAMGIRAVVLTNAAGGINEGYRQGQLVALADHINLMGWNPLVGPNEPRFALQPEAELHSPAAAPHLPASSLDLLASGPQFPASGLRFPDMTEAYSKRLRALAKQVAGEEGFALDEGVYLAVSGPSFETPAEIRAFRTLGATLVGMSTVPETIVARHMGIEVLAISCVANLAAGLSTTPLSHEEVQETGQRVERRVARLLQRLAPKIAALAGAVVEE